ncbi:MAG: ATP-binding protein [Ardenticatenaceae bacterium]|nr:ATP-binding protein [Ardenticatenaceae bacterium]
MTFFRRQSLSWQLTLSYLFLVGVTVAALGLVSLQVTRRTFGAFVVESGQRKARELAVFLGQYYQRQGESWAGVQLLVEQLGRLPDERPVPARPRLLPRIIARLPLQPRDRVLIAGPDGRVLAASERRDLGRVLPEATLARGAPVLVEGRQVGTVLVGANLGVLGAAERTYLSRLNRGNLVVMMLVGGVALMLGAWLAQRITEPARALTAAANRLAAGDWREPLPVRSTDELGQMSAAFNAMAIEIEQQNRLRRQMVADIAHELRTPLSVMRLELEALEDGLQESADATRSLRGEIDLLTQLVEDLGLLAQNDAGEQPLDLAATDVGVLVEETVTRWQGRALARGLSLRAAIAPNLPQVHLDRSRITRVLTNLLANALRHTSEGGEIVIAAAAEPGAVRLSVHDTGEGIPPDELESVFERFYRLDRARSRATGGSGLGLAIARQAVELHGGRICAESSGVPGEGTTIRVTLPLVPRLAS